MVNLFCSILTVLFKVQKLHDAESNQINVCYVLLYSSGFATCLDDVPTNTQFDVDPNELVGLTYTADDQCRTEYGPSAVFCPFSFGIQVSKLSLEYYRVYLCIFLLNRKCAHVCGVNQMEDLVLLEMFLPQMAQTVDPVM